MFKNIDIKWGALLVALVPVLFLLIWIPLVLWQSLAIVTLWAWFIVPIFSVPVLGYWQAVRVVLTIGAIRPTKVVTSKESGGTWIALLLGPPLLIALGWIVKTLGGI